MNILTSSHTGRKPVWFFISAIALAASMFAMNGLVFAENASIASMLEGKPAVERANIKAAEIAKRNPVGVYTDATYGLRIEVESVSKIDGGVEIFSRAWKDGRQLGFGKDGSVEWERFKIINPPIMVPDGTKHSVTRDDISFQVDNFKEDPVAAIQADLAHTISIVGKEGAAIVLGKRGNTTSTFHPAAGANLPVDGYTSNPTSSWDAAHDATTANTDATDTTIDIVSHRSNSTSFLIERAATLFNTGAGINAADTIDSATVSIYVLAKTNTDNDGNDYVGVVQLANGWASASGVSAGDHDQVGSAIDNPTQGAAGIDITSMIPSGARYENFTLNATGLGWIARSGETKPAGFVASGITALGWRTGHDILDDPHTSDNTRDAAFFSSADTGDTTQDPKLVIEHSAPPVLGYAVRKSATQTTSSDTTTDDDSDLTLVLGADKEYDIHGVIFASSTSQVPDIKVAFIAPSGAEMDIAVIPSSAEQAELLQASNTDTDGIPIPANQPITIQVVGSVKIGSTGGSLKFQWAQNQSDAAAVGVLRGSYLRADEI